MCQDKIKISFWNVNRVGTSTESCKECPFKTRILIPLAGGLPHPLIKKITPPKNKAKAKFLKRGVFILF